MPNLEVLVARGYFPRELPPAFSPRGFASFLATNQVALPPRFNHHNLIAKTSSHNLARSGSLRRKLGIPNPVLFYQLASCIVDNWLDLQRIASQSTFSLTTPVDGIMSRAIERQYSLTERPIRRAQLRSTARYILQADINRFYPSVYTHSIPWAIHTKAVAKANRGDGYIGNRIDRLVRNGQDGQTMGIPIGPDTSLLLAEIILNALDMRLASNGITSGFRYIDDYELGFKTLAEAEESLSFLQEVLNDYELALNPNKTRIIKLPVPTELLAISELRTFQFRTSVSGQESDILRYFDRAFVLSNENPEEGVLKYAISRLSGEMVHSRNWPLVEKLLLQSIMAEAGAISLALNQILRYRDMHYAIDRDRISDVFNDTICQHAPLGHGSEVAWSLWGLLVLRYHMSAESFRAAISMNDSIVSLLLLDAADKNLIPSGADFTSIETLMTTEELFDEHWLLAFEANIKGWLPSEGGGDHVDHDECFSALKNNGVSFYDDTLSNQIVFQPPAGWAETY
jgi:hypothetical protein